MQKVHYMPNAENRWPIYFLTSWLLCMYACKKEDVAIKNPPPASIPDSTLAISDIRKVDAGEFEIAYTAKPPAGEKYENLSIVYSTKADFSEVADSAVLSSAVTAETSQKKQITGFTKYGPQYFRLSVKYRNKLFFSEIKSINNDSLIITQTDHTSMFPFVAVARGMKVRIRTNSNADTTMQYQVGTKIFLGDYECPVDLDKGSSLIYTVPQSVPPGSYQLRLERKGLVGYYERPIHIVQGKWTTLNTPDLPPRLGMYENGLVRFGNCASSSKGYMVGGHYAYEHSYGSPDFGRPPHIIEFDGASGSWRRITPSNPRYFDDPICYYYNNAIYVVGGMETDKHNGMYKAVQKLLKFDLVSQQWVELGDLPYEGITGLNSFELNGEWYVGGGVDTKNLSECCGDPQPSKAFWKYNPAQDLWIRIADFPGSHQFKATGFSIGTKGYLYLGAIELLGRINPTVTKNELWEYDGGASTWKALPPPDMMEMDGINFGVAVYNNKAYFTTGEVMFQYYNGFGLSLQRAFVEFDPASNKFTSNNLTKNNHTGVMKLIYKQGNRFVFQTAGAPYMDVLPPMNRTDELIIE